MVWCEGSRSNPSKRPRRPSGKFAQFIALRGGFMRVMTSFLALLLAVWSLVGSAGMAGADATRAQVMVVGVAHLVARNDVYNSVFTDDPLGPKRQAQIADVVARLARFAPTKVLVEADAGNPVYEQRYQAYRTGAYILPANEVYQFGFRLAAAAGNPAIYPIDNDGPSLIDDKTPTGKRMLQFLKSNFKAVLDSDPVFTAFVNRQSEIERTGTYLDLLRYLNSEDAVRANAGSYSVMTGTGRDVNFAGSAYVAQWYGRNCYIFSNILNVTSPGERLVVLMGQGHEYLLREFVRLNPHLEDVDPLMYLK